ncbi:uncharacterized protein BX663DRAFT_114201 [Cokeromyces recurvatus]|uniref:uncharacterized protein n=1 Tax=Cokeromyces recurvatus TaxID=90255 RepID=UPI00221F1C24|nr:uncharacterized protein BX663DRAFT_114201 [Cokeromyces recurvatus]KAI7901150.1 hypothetical protein BX663DRAFT_114201 [Cokeromyces recurvatus]
MQELKYKLYLTEVKNKKLESKLKDVEELARVKEHEVLNLKKQVTKYQTDIDQSQSKRVFPGTPFPTKLKALKPKKYSILFFLMKEVYYHQLLQIKNHLQYHLNNQYQLMYRNY